MNYPKGIQFKSVKPQGFYQEYRDYFVTPVQTYTNQFSIYDIVRIQFNLQDWYIDPYESYIEAEVRLQNESILPKNTGVDFSSANGTGVKFYMMDGPSTSLINDFRFEVNSKEIERIREYDQVGNLLTDLNLYPDVVDQKDYEGYYSIKGKNTVSQQLNLSNSQVFSGGNATSYGIYQRQSNVNLFPNQTMTSGGTAADPIVSVGFRNVASPISISTNLGPFDIGELQTWQADLRASSGGGYTGAATSHVCSTEQSLLDITDAKFNPSIPYESVFSYSSFLGGLTSSNSNFGICHADYKYNTGSTSGNGFIPVKESPKIDQIDGHNIFLTNMPTAKLVNGKFIQSPLYIDSTNKICSRAYMQIPLLSGVMGVLIPQERWQLIPSSSLGQVNMEFRFNPNAFFSHDGQKPDWIVTKFQLRLRMYRFATPVMDQLRAQVQGGIQMHSQVFSMGPIYNIQPNVSITNNWQLNNGIPSIKQLFFWFLSNDFETYWGARKNFKLSQNVTSMQLKVGSTYMPQNPIIGHAGNIVMNSLVQQDNSVYLSELHQAMNLLFDCKRHININKLNFAINERPYDVTMNSTILATTVGGSSLSALRARVFKNAGYSLWNEMRCRGKAVYAFNLEMDKKNDDTMSGLDTTKVRPIELILKNDDGNYYARQSTMYVMFLSDFIVTFGANETNTEGAG